MNRFKSDKSELMDEDYYFQIADTFDDDRMFVLIIYDIIDNNRRVRFAKMLQGYGCRVQKSAFEALISRKKYEKLSADIPKYITDEDNVRLYKIVGKGQVVSWGELEREEEEEIILI